MQDFLSQRVDQIDPYLAIPARQSGRLPLPVQSQRCVDHADLSPVYTAATIADDSEIVHTFGASLEAVAKPITSTSLAGVGERMILVARS